MSGSSRPTITPLTPLAHLNMMSAPERAECTRQTAKVTTTP